MGTSIWSPLFGGVLTGKYINEVPKQCRFNDFKNIDPHEMDYQKNKKEWDSKLLKLKEIAEKKLNCSVAQLGVAWVIANPDISTCILGASKATQLIENLKAVEIYKRMTKEILFEIETILNNAPEREMDFRDWKMLPNRRNLILGINYPKTD